MKRQAQSQPRGNLPPRINTPNNQEFLKDYFSAHHQPTPFSPVKNVENNMFNNMYYPNIQMMSPSNGPMYDGMEDMSRGINTPTTPIRPMNDVGQFNIPVPYPQQPMINAPPYIRGNGPYMNNNHHGNEEMMLPMMKEQNNNLLSPVVMENTGGAQNNKKANLYKTELCRSFEETGQCRYGSKCQFAHSESELRHVDRHPKYKTEMCKTFWEQGTCPYGKRCCFIHMPRDLSKKEDVPVPTPTTPAKTAEKKSFPDTMTEATKKKENSTDSNNLSEGETLAITSEEGEATANNRSRSGSDSTTAASITEEVISTANDTEAKASEEPSKSSEVKVKEKNKDDTKEDKKESTIASETSTPEKEKTKATPSIAINNSKAGSSKGRIASSFDAMARTPTTNQTFNYSTSFSGSMSNGLMNGSYTPRRKMSSPPQRQNPKLNTPTKSFNFNNNSLDMNGNYNGLLGMNSMSYQPASPFEDYMFSNSNTNSNNGKSMSTSFPANDYLDEAMMYKLKNLHIQTTPPHTPINNQRGSASQNNQGMISPLSSSFNQNNIFMKQPLNINTTSNSSNLFLKQTATASPFTPGTPSSYLSPKQTHMGLPSIPMIDDESSSLKGPGSVSGKGSDYGDETKSNEENSTVLGSNNLFVKQAINTSKTGTPHSFLKVSQNPSTPKNSFLPSTPQSISNGFLTNNGSVSPLPSSRMGTSLPTTPIHPNSFNPSAIEDIFSGNNNTIINDFSRSNSTGINMATSPFTTTNDLSQYMMQMSSARENSTGLQSLENIKSPSQLFYRGSSGSINSMNATPNTKSNGGFGSMTMGGIGMVKNRSESFDYGMLSPNGMNSFLGAGNPVSSPAAAFNSLASSFNSSFLSNKVRSESVDFGQLGHYTKDNSMVGSVPTLSYLQSISEGIPDSPFSNNGSIHGSPLPSTTTTLNDLNGNGMNLGGDLLGGGRRKSFPDSYLTPNRLPTVPEGKHPNILEEEEEGERLFKNNTLTDEGILKFSKEHFGLDDAHSKSLLGGNGSSAMDIKGSVLQNSIFSPLSPSSATNNFF